MWIHRLPIEGKYHSLFPEWKGLACMMPTLDMDNELQAEFSLYFTSIKNSRNKLFLILIDKWNIAF